jgi:ribonuclease Z
MLFFMALLVAAMWAASFASKEQEREIAGVVPLDPRHFEQTTLVVAGSGGTFENHWRRGPAIVVGLGKDLVLIDAGRGASESLRAARIPVEQPRTVFLTNLAPESVLGLDELWLDAWLRAPEQPLRVVGPVGTKTFVDGLLAAYTVPVGVLTKAWAPVPEGGRVEVTEWAGGESLEVGALSVRSTPLRGGATASLGYRIEGGERSVAIAVAGSDERAVVQLAQDAHILVLEGIYGASLEQAKQASEIDNLAGILEEAAGHLLVEDAGRIGTDADVYSIVLTRLRPPPVFDFQFERLVAETYRGGPVIVAEDGEELTP